MCFGELLIGGGVEAPRILQDARHPTKVYRFLRAGAWNPVKILEKFYAQTDAPVLVFKAMYNQLSNARVRKFLCEHRDIRIIHLRRDNLLKQYVSKKLLGKKRERRWLSHSTTQVRPVSTRVSPQAVIAEMRRVGHQFDEFEALLSHHHKIELVYEELINGHCLSDDAAAAIQRLFEIEPAPMCCEFVKVNPNSLELMVENYNELAAALKGTEFERFLK